MAKPPAPHFKLATIENQPSLRNTGSCTVCGQKFSDPNRLHLCQAVKRALEAQNKRAPKSPGPLNMVKAVVSNDSPPPPQFSPRAAATTAAHTSSDPVSSLDIPTPTSIEVLIRVRPLLFHESDEDTRNATSVITTLDDNRTVSINHPQKQLQCEYDYSFPQSAAQEEIYDKVNSCVNSFTNGFNATIFAYGQTGSGKTHTMFGPEGYAVQRSSFGGPNHAILNANAGVIPRSIVQIFKNLNRKDLGIVSVTAYVSFVQVYNEQLYDMLRDPRRSSSLEIHEEPGQGIYVSGLSEYAVRNAGDCLALVKLGEENRAIRETHMNTASSRSHSLFQIIVEQTRIEDGAEGERVLKSKFNLVDLAGSEKWDTRKERKFNEDQISELTNINLSLYTLGRCIAALAKNGKALEKDPDSIPTHVPYRESKLTRLLQDSLGGNSKTVLIATLSPASDCLEETVSTLRFADRAHSVMTFVKLNEKRPVDHALVQRLQSEVARLRALLRGGGAVSESDISGMATTPSTSVPASSDASGNEVLAKAMERITFLENNNNTLRRRLGMPELPPSRLGGVSLRQTGTPQRHTPSKFAIVGGGNSDDANRLRTGNGGGGGEASGAAAQHLIEMRSSHERLAALMMNIDRVTSRFFTFEIEEEELKDGVTKFIKVFKKEKKGYVDLYARVDRDGCGIPVRGSPNYAGKGGTNIIGGSGVKPAKNLMSGPPTTFKKENNSPFGSSSPDRTSVFGNSGKGGGKVLGLSGSVNAAGAVGVAYRIREKGEKVKGRGPSTVSPKRGGKNKNSNPLNNSVDGWIQDEADEEEMLRKELKAAKARMKKQTEMQDWLEKKEEKAIKQLEEEENARKKFMADQNDKDKKFRNRAKKQKRKLEKYYEKLRAEMGELGLDQGEEGLRQAQQNMTEADMGRYGEAELGRYGGLGSDSFDDGAGGFNAE